MSRVGRFVEWGWLERNVGDSFGVGITTKAHNTMPRRLPGTRLFVGAGESEEPRTERNEADDERTEEKESEGDWLPFGLFGRPQPTTPRPLLPIDRPIGIGEGSIDSTRIDRLELIDLRRRGVGVVGSVGRRPPPPSPTLVRASAQQRKAAVGCLCVPPPRAHCRRRRPTLAGAVDRSIDQLIGCVLEWSESKSAAAAAAVV